MNNSNNTLIVAAIISTAVNFIGINEYYKMQNFSNNAFLKQEEEVLFTLPDKDSKSYLDSTIKTDKEIVSENISDVSSEADSSKKGNNDGIIPKAEIKDLFSQTERGAEITSNPTIEHLVEIEKTIMEMNKKDEVKREKSVFKDEISLTEEKNIDKKENENKENDLKEDNSLKHLNPEEALQTLKQTPVNLQKQQPKNDKEDLFPLPMISIGDKTTSKYGIDSFDMKGTDLGKYLKQVREKLGLKFYQMIFFHYKSSFIFESKVEVSFSILKDGKIGKVSAKFIKGDPMFKEYCLTVINAASPFPPLPLNIEPFMETDGTFKLDILFGYNVKE